MANILQPLLQHKDGVSQTAKDAKVSPRILQSLQVKSSATALKLADSHADESTESSEISELGDMYGHSTPGM